MLADDRIIVKDIEEDLFDGQILQKLIGKMNILERFESFGLLALPFIKF